MRILVTRPLPDGERTAQALSAAGHDVMLVPLTRVRPVVADLSGVWAAVIITSVNAVRAVPPVQLEPLRALPLFAVGERSAEAARAAGFHDVHTPRGDAADLVRLLVSRGLGHSHPYLYLAGAERAADIEGALGRAGIAAVTAVVYRTVTTGFPPDLFDAVDRGSIDAVLHFSRRSAETYLAGAKDAGLLAAAVKPRQLCISKTVADVLAQAGANAIEIAGRPDEASLLALVGPRPPRSPRLPRLPRLP
jgi:uroporphyrinogen-III synthase